MIQFSKGFLDSIVKYSEISIAHSTNALNIVDVEIDKATKILEELEEAKTTITRNHEKNSGQLEL